MNKQFSKVFAVILAVTMLLTQILVPVTADPEPVQGQDEVETLPTCTCSEDIQAQYVDGVGGDHWYDYVPATCTDYAYDEYLCDNCGKYFPVVRYDEPALGHDLADYDQDEEPDLIEACEPTCEEDGVLVSHYHCNRCDQCLEECIIEGDTPEDTIVVYKTIVVLDETQDVTLENLTSVEPEYLKAFFDDEANEDARIATEEDLVIPALGHNYVAEEVPATCTEGGYTHYECSNCGDEYDEEGDGEPDPDAHPEESVSIVEEIPMICGVQDGKTIYTCADCGEQWEEVTQAYDPDHLIHNFTNFIEVVSEATCTTPALWRYSCGVCGWEAILESQEEGALGHNYTEEDWVEAVEATCTEDGNYGYFYCDRCGQYFDENGDVYVMVSGDAGQGELELTTVPEDELETLFEEDENARLAEEDDLVIEALGHDWDDGVVTAPTCIAGGYTTYTCQRVVGQDEETGEDILCGATYVDDETDIDPLAHKPYNSIERVLPTCGAIGWTEEVRCEYCNALFASPKQIPALEHVAGEPVEENTVEPTCTEGGSYEMATYCENCGIELDRQYFDTEAQGHNFTEEDWVEANEATCEEDGNYGYYFCDRCGQYFDEDENVYVVTGEDELITVPEEELEEFFAEDEDARLADEDDMFIAAAHDWKHKGYVLPTCTEGGYSIKQCERCRATERYDFVDALGHDYAAVVTDPTCTEGGYTTYTCQRVVGQDEETGEDILCGDTYDDDFTDALGHNYAAVVTEPTCTEEGYTTYTCTRCQDSYDTDFVDALGHNYEDVVTEPTCEEGGYTTHTCTRCGDSYDDDFTDELGHDYEDVVTEPTCEEGGYTTYTCTRCGDTYDDDFTDALGHDPQSELQDDGEGNVVEVIICGRCGEELGNIVEDEGIQFNYEATGINASEYAVNSGVIYLNVYMDVLSTYARLYGVDFAIEFNEHLTLVDVNFETDLNANGCIFKVAENTNIALANELHKVRLAQNMGVAGAADKVFTQGRYLFATLMFKVDKDFFAEDVWFGYVEDEETNEYGTAVRYDTYANDLDVDFYGEEDGAWINVTMLGDTDGNHRIDTIDARDFTAWVLGAEDEDAYEGIFDMDKDGFVTGDDFDLLLNAIVSNNEYLDICKILEGLN